MNYKAPLLLTLLMYSLGLCHGSTLIIKLQLFENFLSTRFPLRFLSSHLLRRQSLVLVNFVIPRDAPGFDLWLTFIMDFSPGLLRVVRGHSVRLIICCSLAQHRVLDFSALVLRWL
jgi:hypothetical protein